MRGSHSAGHGASSSMLPSVWMYSAIRGIEHVHLYASPSSHSQQQMIIKDRRGGGGGIIGYCFVFVSFPPIYSSLDSLSFGCIFWGGVRTISALRIFAGEHTSSHRRRARAVGDTAIVMRYHDA